MNTHYVRIWGWWVHKGTITIFPLLIHPSCWTARFLIHRQSVNFLRMYMYVCYSSQQVKKIIYLSKPAIVLRFPCWFHLFAGVCTCISIFLGGDFFQVSKKSSFGVFVWCPTTGGMSPFSDLPTKNIHRDQRAGHLQLTDLLRRQGLK